MTRVRTSAPQGLADNRPGNNSAALRLHVHGPLQPMIEPTGWIRRVFGKVK